MNAIRNVIDVIKMSYRVTNPWKSNHNTEEYNKGWNECLKAIKKAQKDHLDRLELLAQAIDKTEETK